MAATLLISSRNYSSWSLRGFLLCHLARLEFEEKSVDFDDPDNRAELLLKASSIRVPCLIHDGVTVWDTLAIAEYLHEAFPRTGMYPLDRMARARCRSISGEMHSGFSALRSSLPMNLRLHRSGVPLWSAVRADIARITEIWRDCLGTWGGPWLFGRTPGVADAMYAPVVTRFRSYEVDMDATCDAYCDHLMAWPAMQEWIAAALQEPEQIDELDVEF
ncbi:MAG TPA: glutathione S-transferase family protein [Acetobacteraceae bacterium]|nr:glutathione S-transferase family protein [Acetobacteraceae bacterium]